MKATRYIFRGMAATTARGREFIVKQQYFHQLKAMALPIEGLLACFISAVQIFPFSGIGVFSLSVP
jgi:hypothetical protein